ncbi:MAG: hypothetical protein IJD82_10260 [Clostridia bacterium]|nr:hypothetical protein [Clostridia bacterium]
MEEHKKGNKKLWIICGAAACVLLITVLAAVIGGLADNSAKLTEPTDGYALYVKDGALYYDSLDGVSFCVTDKLLAYDPSAYDTQHGTDPQLYACTTAVAAGDSLFYVERLADPPNGNELYVRSTKTADAVPKLLAKNIASYRPSADGSCVIGVDGDGTLFRCFPADGTREEIAKNVLKGSVRFTKDMQNLIYEVREGEKETTFRKLGGAPAEQIPLCDSYSYADDMRTLWYIDEKGDLYRMDANGDTTFISANAYEIAKLYPTGEAYFTTVAETNCKADQWIFNNTDNKILAETTVTRYGLYYYDGEQSTCLTQYMPYYFLHLSFAQNTPACAFFSLEDATRTAFSTFADLDPRDSRFSDALRQISKLYVAHGSEVSLISSENARWAGLSQDGTELAWISFPTWDATDGDLYELEIKDDKLTEPVFVASGVNSHSPQYLNDGRLYYQKDGRSVDGWYHYDLYLDSTLIGKDYFGGSLVSGISDGTFCFFADRKESHPYTYGTLYNYDGTTAHKVASSVLRSYYAQLPDGKLLYLTNFDESSATGDLYLYDGSKSHLVAKDVLACRYNNPDLTTPIILPSLRLNKTT